ncbi:hypothetical protein NPIL_264081, partial [Nephila pilipes]
MATAMELSVPSNDESAPPPAKANGDDDSTYVCAEEDHKRVHSNDHANTIPAFLRPFERSVFCIFLTIK